MIYYPQKENGNRTIREINKRGNTDVPQIYENMWNITSYQCTADTKAMTKVFLPIKLIKIKKKPTNEGPVMAKAGGGYRHHHTLPVKT